MSDPVDFKLMLDVTAQSDAIVTAFAVDHLKAHGYQVTAPGENKWETPGEFCKRIEIYPHRLKEFILRYELRTGVTLSVDRRGVSGRIKDLQSNAQFVVLCRQQRRSPRKP